MAKIGYLYDVPLPNGHSATIQILRTAQAMAATGDEVTVWTAPHAAPAEPVLASLGIRPHPGLGLAVAFPGRPGDPRLRRWANRLWLGTFGAWADAGVVVSRGPTGFAVASALAGKRAAHRPPFVYEIHRLVAAGEAEARLGRILGPHEGLPRNLLPLQRLEARTMAAADGFIFLTDAVRDAARATFGVDRPAVVAPSGVDVPTSPPAADKDVDVVFLGKIERRKGVDLAIRAIARLEGRRLRCIGDGAWLDDARRLAAGLGVADRVEFAGRVPHAQVPAELARGRIGLCPLPAGLDRVAERFTSPLKLLEMMSAGLPIVATDVVSVRAVCRDGVDARLVPPDAPEMIAAALAELLDDPALAAALASGARRRALDFAWQRRAATISGFLRQFA